MSDRYQGNGQQAPRPRRAAQSAFGFLDAQKPREGAFPLEEIHAATLHEAITSWCAKGYAITFGLTSDGGALGVHLLADGNVRKRYFPTPEEVEAFLTVVSDSQGAGTGT